MSVGKKISVAHFCKILFLHRAFKNRNQWDLNTINLHDGFDEYHRPPKMSRFYIVRNRKTGSISGNLCDLFVSGEHERLASLHVDFDLLGVARAVVEHVAHGQQPLHVAERGQGKLHGERNVFHGHRRQ